MVKPLIKTSQLFILLAILPISLWNCDGGTDCDEFEDSYFYMEEEAKELFPYTGNETLTYLYTSPNDTDTLVFVGKGVETGFYEKTSLHPVCPQGDSEFYEYEKYRFRDEEKGQSFIVENPKKIPDKAINNKYVFYFKHIRSFLSFGQIKFDIPPKGGYSRLTNYAFQDSTLESVLIFEWSNSVANGFTSPIQLVYHNQLGLIKVTNPELSQSYSLLSFKK